MSIWLSKRVAATIFASSLIVCAQAQYKVRQWTNFEDGKIPDNLYWFGSNPEESLKPAELSKVEGMPEKFRKGADRETGKFGLKLIAAPDPTNAKTFNQGVVGQEIMDRDELGEKGRALYQADFFLKGEGDDLPSLAVVAMDASEAATPPEGTKLISAKTGFYRFGMTLGKTLYFSYVAPGQEKAVIFNQDKDLLAQIPKPGWHRFSIVCQGPNDIRCYVDGRETSFSPITEPTLRKLRVGVMLADNARTYDAFADNISIQTSNEAPNLPDSPYQADWTIPPTGGSAGGQSGTAAAPENTGGKTTASANDTWLDPQNAWDAAQKRNVPWLIYFYVPGIAGTQKMDEVFEKNEDAKKFLKERVASKVDVNQLEGGTLAQKYNIFKVPTLLEFSSDAKHIRMATFNKGDDWDQIIKKLDQAKK